ncbi:hypothetical protein C3489_19205 [Streptomyces sp. Ru71]|uniref:hypothetical protein n=1 Tax=Streptomyces sp. Ru71 TaxID=2080746 RepID=UPI000CDDC7B4|nr:hypothetical protein [Streptomyces sp. Ru71]POX51837.1 hypothetical protein C3489_19205 [Streptomyces sp. Ru71]
MSNPEDADPPIPAVGATRITEDGELQYWDGTDWSPYLLLADGEMFRHAVVFREDDAERDDDR